MLAGWIEFRTQRSAFKLPYNTRASGRLDEFIAIVQRTWLGAPTVGKPPDTRKFGPEPDIKFANLLCDALSRGGRWERYAGVTVSAPVSLFQGCRVEATDDRSNLVIEFAAGHSWRIGIDPLESDWGGFSKALKAMMLDSRGTRAIH